MSPIAAWVVLIGLILVGFCVEERLRYRALAKYRQRSIAGSITQVMHEDKVKEFYNIVRELERKGAPEELTISFELAKALVDEIDHFDRPIRRRIYPSDARLQPPPIGVDGRWRL